jgi:hypothetical protein
LSFTDAYSQTATATATLAVINPAWTVAEAPLPADTGDSAGELSGIACPDATGCVIGGSSSSHLVVVSGAGNSWQSTAIPLPADEAGAPTGDVAVACPSSKACTAVGAAVGTAADNSGSENAFIATGSGSSWTAIDAPVPANAMQDWLASHLGGVACPTTSFCVAVGGYKEADIPEGIDDEEDEGLIVTGSGTSWQATEAPLPADAMTAAEGQQVYFDTGVICVSATECYTAGKYKDTSGTYHGVLEAWNGSSWQPVELSGGAQPVVGMLGDVACVSASDCMVISGDTVYYGSGTSWQSATLPLPAGAPADATVTTWGLTCPSASSCVAVGDADDNSSYDEALIFSGLGGSWKAITAPLPANASAYPVSPDFLSELDSVACASTTRCVAVGDYSAYENGTYATAGLLVTGSGTSWTVTQMPASVTSFGPVGCEPDGPCTAVSSPANPSTSLGQLVTGTP